MALSAILSLFSSYETRVERGLDEAYANADREEIDLANLKAVVFSDHHRGRGDGADDFRRCEGAYCAALGWYLAEDYRLWLLGDVEELWENGPRKVMERYDAVLDLEGEFGDRAWRFYGNHDMAWRRRRFVRKWLGERAPADGRVKEAVRVAVKDGDTLVGTLFLVHGHQGTIDSGNLLVVPFSRFAVRVFWGTLQRQFGFASTSPSTNDELRSKHDTAMATWANKQEEALVMIAGHTHHPVFAGTKPPDLDAEVAAAQDAYDDALKTGQGVAAARAALELAKTRKRREDQYDPPPLGRPSYFNTGCCSFGDGDITGLELAEGKIRLVRWLDNGGKATPHELEDPLDLRELFVAVAGVAPELAGA